MKKDVEKNKQELYNKYVLWKLEQLDEGKNYSTLPIFEEWLNIKNISSINGKPKTRLRKK